MCLWFADAIQLFTCLQEMKKFAAVKFIDSEEVEAVPLLWLKSNASGTLCSWPPYRSPTRLSQAITMCEPCTDQWEVYDADIIRRCGEIMLQLHKHKF